MSLKPMAAMLKTELGDDVPLNLVHDCLAQVKAVEDSA